MLKNKMYRNICLGVLLDLARFCSLAKLAAVSDDAVFVGFARGRTAGFELLDDVHPLDDLSEHDVTVVQPAGFHGSDEKLAPVRVGASVSHGHNACE